ncbi:MAG: hypothetical protein JEZ04_18770 [Spirochaetales bacterium]|nr:hypothetical protein [Spirochaetales bacterium]
MKNIKTVSVILLVLFVITSCTTASFSGLSVTKELESFKVVGQFERSVWVNEFFGISGGVNILNITSDAMDDVVFDAIQREILKFSGDAAINVSIRQEVGILESILNTITGTIYAPCNVVISGTIVKYDN